MFYSLAQGIWLPMPDLLYPCAEDEKPFLHIVGTNLIFIGQHCEGEYEKEDKRPGDLRTKRAGHDRKCRM